MGTLCCGMHWTSWWVQGQSRRLLSRLTHVSDLLLLTTLPSSVILFILANGSHSNWLLCSLCSPGERGCAHSPPGFVLSNIQKYEDFSCFIHSPQPMKLLASIQCFPPATLQGILVGLPSSTDFLSGCFAKWSCFCQCRLKRNRPWCWCAGLCKAVPSTSQLHGSAQHQCMMEWGRWPELPQPSLALYPLHFAEG